MNWRDAIFFIVVLGILSGILMYKRAAAQQETPVEVPVRCWDGRCLVPQAVLASLIQRANLCGWDK